MSECVICAERPPEERSQACQRCAGRLAGGLRQIPGLVDELRTELVADEDARDPVAVLLPAGPLQGSWRESRIRSSRPERVPVNVDVVDLTAAVNHAARALRVRGVLGLDVDQDGHLSGATTLHRWVLRWAARRREGEPRRDVVTMCGWLLDRLDWALENDLLLAEFAEEVGGLESALYGLAGKGRARPKPMDAPCPACGLLTLVHPYPDAYIECATVDCGRVLTPLEYEEMVMDLRHEVTAVDVLTVLNSGRPVPLDGVRFAVITEPWLDIPGGERQYSTFERFELLALDRNGREILGDERKPAKHPCTFQDFASLAEAVEFRFGAMEAARPPAGSS